MLVSYLVDSDTSRVVLTLLNAVKQYPVMGFEVDLIIEKPLQTRIKGAGPMVAWVRVQ